MSMYACSVCFFGAPEDPVNVSLRAAILCMLLILIFVMMLFVKFFVGVRKRSKFVN